MNIDKGVLARGSDEQARGLAKWLAAHPDIFERYPQLLTLVRLPHDAGTATSLIEVQVRRLREGNAELRTTLDTLVRNARHNETVNERLHSLALGLQGAASAADVFALVYAAMQDGFRADMAALRIFGAPPPAERGCGEFVGADGATTAAIAACLESGRPVCALPCPATLSLLFGSRASAVESCALIALSAVHWRGVIALGARDTGRFEPGTGTVFLHQLGELVTHALLRVHPGS